MQALSLSSPHPIQTLAQQKSPIENFEAKRSAGTLPASQVCSTDILRGQRERTISHNGCEYRLQVTRLGKLILTK